MKLISEYGANIHIDNKQIPKEAIRCSQRAYLFNDGVELEKCWVATLYENDVVKTMSCDRYEYIAMRIYDHEPSQNEILMFMAKYDAVDMSYVTIDKAFRLNEEKRV